MKDKYARWGRWAQFVAIAVPVAALAGGGLAAALHSGGSVSASSAEHISFPLAAIRVVPAGRIAGEGSHLSAALGQAAVRGAADPVGRTAWRGRKPSAPRRVAGQSGIPAGVLGTWSGQIALTKSLTESFALSLTRPGTAGSSVAVGTFTNQTAGCSGSVFLDGVSGGTVVELSFARTVDPLHACPASMEADVQLAPGGSALDYEIIGVDSVRVTPQNPLAEGALYR